MRPNWENDKVPRIGREPEPEPPRPAPQPVSDIAKVPAFKSVKPVWGVTAIFLFLYTVCMAFVVSNQNRTIAEMMVQVSDLRIKTQMLDKLVANIDTRMEELERTPRTVPTTAIMKDGVTRQEVGEVKAAIEEQGHKLDAVLEGLQGVRRRR
jgi:hypothetical protein